VTVYGEGVQGASGETALEKGLAYARSILPDPSYSVAPAGQAETMKESFGYLIFALWMAVMISYIILAGQYNNFLHPLTILSALPLSTIGAFAGLLVFGQTLNIMSMIGMILLLGIVKKNSILMVDFTNQLRDQGMERREALFKACPIRLRPILMTAIATIAGVLPTAIGIGTGAEARRPMAVAILGGMISSTFLTLYVVPAIYTYFDDLLPLSQRLLGKLQGFTGRFSKPTPKTEEPLWVGGPKEDGDGIR
jgi:HAE1 family hydrophobic/amphiphilic exporter-1